MKQVTSSLALGVHQPQAVVGLPGAYAPEDSPTSCSMTTNSHCACTNERGHVSQAGFCRVLFAWTSALQSLYDKLRGNTENDFAHVNDYTSSSLSFVEGFLGRIVFLPISLEYSSNAFANSF
jgi:hypothetical protein